MYQKTVLITGVSRGIGRACAIAFAKEGYQIAGCCRTNTSLLEALRAELDTLRVPHLLLTGDVSDSGFVDRLFSETQKRFGHLDLLINNAGISKIGLLELMSDADWNRIVSVNLSSVFYCCRSAIPLFLKNRDIVAPNEACGRILNVSSIWGCSGASCEAAYSATKGGMNAITEALAKELAPSRIPVNALACGVIDTDMNRCFSDEERAALEEEIPVGRFATPEETAHALFLLSQMPSYLTGQIIRFDGGLL